MAFMKEYISYLWGENTRNSDANDLQAFTTFLEKAEKDRQRE
jgi:hypothetical protein